MPPSDPLISPEKTASPSVWEAAEALERHIRLSGLKPGDRYITAEEAGRLLGKSVMTAQRAMTLLAQRNLLERRPKAGTFIAEAATTKADLKCIHLLLPEQFMNEEKSMESYWNRVHLEISGMRSVLPNLSVQFNFIPNQDVGYAQQVIDKAYKAGSLSGVILLISSRAMRAHFNDSGIPTVVEGSVETDLNNLCWLTWDQKQMGKLLASYLLHRGHRRLATMMRDVWSAGEHLLHDGIGEVIAEAGLSSNALRIRSTPPDRAAALGVARALLSEDDTYPTGILCRNQLQADCVTEVAQEMGLGDQVEAVLCNAPFSREAKYTCVEAEMDGVECGKIIGGMFRDLMEHKTPENKGVLVGVKLLNARPTG